MAFIGVSGCSVEAGFTCGREGDMLVKQLVIQKARTSVAMCGQEKFNCLMPYTYAKMGDFDFLVTDGAVSEAFSKAAREVNMTIL